MKLKRNAVNVRETALQPQEKQMEFRNLGFSTRASFQQDLEFK